jgi:hypothetical protein
VKAVLSGDSPRRVPVAAWDPFRDKEGFRAALLDKVRDLNRTGEMTYEGLTVSKAYNFTPSGDVTDGSSNLELVSLFEFAQSSGANVWKYVPPGQDQRC